MSRPDLDEAQRAAALQSIEERYQNEIVEARKDAHKMGLMDLALNIPVLMADNFFTFGKLYSKGFDTAATNAKNLVTPRKGIMGLWDRARNVNRKANNAMIEATNDMARRTTKDEAGNYLWKILTTKEGLKRGALTGLREGNEELAQAMVAEFSTNLFSDTPDSYYRAISHPAAKRESLGVIDSLVKAFADTYGNGDRYEEFAIGALTGLLGTPTFGKVQNADASTYLGRGKMIGLSGGIFGELSSARELNKRGQEAVKQMNRLKGKIDESGKSLMMRKAFNDAMDGWAEAQDKFEWKSQEDNSIWAGINAFLSTGRKDDLL